MEGELFQNRSILRSIPPTESARFTEEDVERLKKLVEEKAKMRREGLLKQRSPVFKVEAEDNELGGDVFEPERGESPGQNLAFKQESGLGLEIKREPGVKVEIRDEKGGWKELDQSSYGGRPGVSAEHYILQDQKNNRKEPLKKSGQKEKSLKLKLKLVKDETWEVSPLLPNGWKFCQGSRVFRTSKGKALQSYSKALQHMMVTDGYTDEQMDNLQKFIEEKDAAGEEWDSDLEDMEEEHQSVSEKDSTVKRENPGDGKKSFQLQKAQSKTPLKPSIKLEPKTNSDPSNSPTSSSKQVGLVGTPQSVKRRASSGDWQSSPTIPPAWKVRNEGQGKAEFFLSPGGNQLTSRRSALQCLVKEGSTEEEVEEMRSMLRFEGYEAHQHLPENWLIKYTFTDIASSWVSILNQEGEEFKSFLKAQEFMRSDPRYGEHYVEQMKYLVEEKAMERRLGDPAWRKDSSVPKGWKLRSATDPKAKGEKEFLLSKDGRQFAGRRVALKAMVSEGGWDPAEVDEMRQKLPHEGWRQEEGLPRLWFAKSIRKKGIASGFSYVTGVYKCFLYLLNFLFVTETGEKLESTRRAVQWLNDQQRGAEV